MNVVADTHAVVWWVSQSKKLSKAATRALSSASRHGRIHVSAISIFEIATLVARQRLQLGVPVAKWIAALRSLPEIQVEPITCEIAQAAAAFGSTISNDPADRLVVATSLELGVDLVSADSAILDGAADAGINVIW